MAAWWLRTFLLVLLALYGTNIQAQNQKLSVDILEETPDSKRIAQAVTARIGSTARYTAHLGLGDAELSLDVMCFTMEKMVITPAAQGMDGYVCAYHTDYHPAQLLPLQTTLGVGRLQSGTFAQVVETIFDDFVMDTSDDELQASANELIQRASLFCREHKSICESRQNKKSKTIAPVRKTS